MPIVKTDKNVINKYTLLSENDRQMETLEEVLTDLHSIARELNKPFDDGDVICEYGKRHNECSEEIANYVIHPIYFPPEECVINNSKDAMTWTEVRAFVKKNNISEQQFYLYLQKNTTPPVVDEVIRLIVNHVFHSEDERLIAPPHLRIDENGNYPFLHHHK